MNISDRDKKIAFGIVPILLIAAFWFLVLAPKRQEASDAAAAQAKQEKRRASAQLLVDSANGAKTDFSADFTQIVRLGQAIPAQVDMPSVIVQLDAAAAGTGIQFTKIATGERVEVPEPVAPAPTTEGENATPAAAGGEAAQSAPGAATESANNAQQTADQQAAAAEQSGVDATTSTSSGSGLAVGGGAAAPGAALVAGTPPAGLETVPLELEFVGNFFNLADFFHSVKRFVRVANQDVRISGRLITVEGVRWASESDIFPRIRATVKATMYLSPKAQGSTAGATPGGPATTTPATATPAESSPEPAVTPTATASP